MDRKYPSDGAADDKSLPPSILENRLTIHHPYRSNALDEDRVLIEELNELRADILKRRPVYAYHSEGNRLETTLLRIGYSKEKIRNTAFKSEESTLYLRTGSRCTDYLVASAMDVKLLGEWGTYHYFRTGPGKSERKRLVNDITGAMSSEVESDIYWAAYWTSFVSDCALGWSTGELMHVDASTWAFGFLGLTAYIVIKNFVREEPYSRARRIEKAHHTVRVAALLDALYLPLTEEYDG
ncbi:hypothetical protein KY363_01745 [Candidatus Woesearchaeota archaeon]|nr:hypothetical protein [Candidatus Woesearchaeota archaeon]